MAQPMTSWESRVNALIEQSAARQDAERQPPAVPGSSSSSGSSPSSPSSPSQSFNEEHILIWRHLERELTPLGTWQSRYAITIEMLVRTYCRWKELDSQVNSEGMILTSPKLHEGTPVILEDGTQIVEHKTNPAFREWHSLTGTIRKLCGDLGLTPEVLHGMKELI